MNTLAAGLTQNVIKDPGAFVGSALAGGTAGALLGGGIPNVGLGGIGSTALQHLAAAGIGKNWISRSRHCRTIQSTETDNLYPLRYWKEESQSRVKLYKELEQKCSCYRVRLFFKDK